MKPLYYLPPLLAFGISAVYLGSQHQKLTALEEQRRVMRERIAAVETGSLSNHQPEATASDLISKKEARGPFLDNGTIDWVLLAELTASSQEGMPRNIKSIIKVQQKLLSMEVEDIQKSLKLIARLELSSKGRTALEMMLARVMIEKDPQKALVYYEKHLGENDSGMSYQLRDAFGNWARKDPIAALAWFDGKKAAGAFNSKELDPNAGSAQEFQAQVLGALLASDPAQVDARLQGLPKDEIRRMLSNSSLWNQRTGAESHIKAYHDLVRRHLDDEGQKAIIGTSIAMDVIRNGELSQVSEKLAGSELTGAERAAAIDKVAQHYARPWDREPSELRDVYTWAQTEDPDRAEELAANAFATYGNHRNTDFEATFQEVLDLSVEVQKPEIVTAFVSKLERAQQQVAQIKNETLRTTLEVLISELPAE